MECLFHSLFLRKNTLTPPSILSLEQCLEFIADDELVEVTPENIRMRKRILSKEQRMKQAFHKK
jgi:GTP-binding protein